MVTGEMCFDLLLPFTFLSYKMRDGQLKRFKSEKF